MKNLPKPLYYLVVIAIALGSYLGGRYIVHALFTQYEINQAVSKANDPNSAPVVSTEEAKQEFIGGCMTTDYTGTDFNQQTYCGCTFDILEKTKGTNWIIKAGLNPQDPGVLTEVNTASTECLRQQNINI